MKERAARVAEELGLSEDQKIKWQEVMKEQNEKRKALREDTSLSEEEKRAKGKALREETDAKIKASSPLNNSRSGRSSAKSTAPAARRPARRAQARRGQTAGDKPKQD